MDRRTVDKFKQQLLTLLAELEAVDTVAKAATATVMLDQSSVGRLSRMDALQGQQMALANVRRRATQIQQIKAALVRIDTDNFGDCLQCGEAIADGRLAINPALTLCVNCAE